MLMSVMRLRKLPGIYRPAIAVMWPSQNPQEHNIMLDGGADIRADAKDLMQYALMGASYARNGFGLARPRIGLLNVGTEEHKGRAELREAYDLIAANAKAADFEFVGFVEGRDLPGTVCDVIVTDGFTGNVALKTGEGIAKLIADLLREAFNYSPLSRLAALLAYTSLQRMKKRVDPRRANGGVFLGLNGTVVKSHGSADATGVSSAIKLAFELAHSRFTERLAARVAAAAPVEDEHAGPDETGPEEGTTP
jgi:glycerol-3-phosphate acyltransferase PlsX